jgi:hypothetical protein
MNATKDETTSAQLPLSDRHANAAGTICGAHTPVRSSGALGLAAPLPTGAPGPPFTGSLILPVWSMMVCRP